MMLEDYVWMVDKKNQGGGGEGGRGESTTEDAMSYLKWFVFCTISVFNSYGKAAGFFSCKINFPGKQTSQRLHLFQSSLIVSVTYPAEVCYLFKHRMKSEKETLIE